ncbi:unnamed protein product [Adineta steineri]|uniref:G-protein coupled receptors family 1 profile domain-containing protein n=1 Tax=Adineta steineri TaxID=433720 RepID=A0A815DL44_9BILA|nr:unnamed protein product [Adineta steineri]CAF3765843.1 unnamed protein product [Adineta steineri]
MIVFETLSSILMVICSIFGIICAFLFIIIVLTHRQCHTLTILLVFNSTIAGLIANTTCISQAIYQLLDVANDSLCTVRGLFLQAGTGVLYHTLCVQALYRLFVTVYSARRSLQTTRFIILVVVIQWIFSISFGLPILFTGHITYQQGSRICQVSLEDTIGFIYFASIIFFIPLIMIVYIYFRIVKYMKDNPFSTTNRSTINGQQRHQSELRLIRRILTLVIILFILGFPYFLFYLLIHLHIVSPWSYMPRISYLFITFGQSASMLINLITTDDVKKSLINIIRKCFGKKDPAQHITL